VYGGNVPSRGAAVSGGRGQFNPGRIVQVDPGMKDSFSSYNYKVINRFQALLYIFNLRPSTWAPSTP
jgi:hypothetical protein